VSPTVADKWLDLEMIRQCGHVLLKQIGVLKPLPVLGDMINAFRDRQALLDYRRRATGDRFAKKRGARAYCPGARRFKHL
jgi:hypothetical protein